MRKIKKFLVSVLAFTAMILCFLVGRPVKTEAASSPNLKVDYFVVTKADYDAYYSQTDNAEYFGSYNLTRYLTAITSYLNSYYTNYQVYIDDGETVEDAKAFAKADAEGTYSTTNGPGRAKTGWTPISFEEAYERVFRPDIKLASKALTSVTSTTGDIVVVPIVTIDSGQVFSVSTVIDVSAFADSYSINALTPNGTTAQNNTYTGANAGNIKLGWNGDVSTYGGYRLEQGATMSLGGINVTLKSSLPSNLSVAISEKASVKADTLFQVYDGTSVTPYDYNRTPDNFTSEPLLISSATPTADSNLNELKVNGTSVMSTEVHTEGSNLYEYTYGETGGPGSEIDIEQTGNVNATILATVDNLGTVTSITYGNSLTNITANSASTTSGVVDMKKAKTGSYLYVQIKTLASDGDAAHTSTINLKIKTKKSAKNELASIDIDSTIPTGYTYMPGHSKVNRIDAKTPTSAAVDADGLGFVPSSSNDSTNDYCITVGEEADSIILKPEYANTMTVKVNGNAPSSTALKVPTNPDSNIIGTFEVTSGISHGDVITIEVTAQDGTSKRTYKFKVNRLARKLTLDSLTVSAGGTFNAADQLYDLTGVTLPVPYSTASVSATANVTAVNGVYSKVNLKYGLTTASATVNNNRTTGAAANATVTYSTTITPAGAAQTAVFEVTVTNDFGETSTTPITVSIDRDAADNTIDLKFPDSTAIAEVSTYNWTTRSWTTSGATGNTTNPITTDPTFASNTYKYATQPFGTRYVTVNLTPLKATTTYYSDAARTVDITGQNYQIPLFSTTPTAVGANPSKVIYAKTEAGNAQFNLEFPYNPADTDSTVSYKIKSYNSNTNTMDYIYPKTTVGNKSTYVFDTTIYQSGTFDIVDVTTGKTTTSVFTSTNNTNFNTLTSTQYTGSATYSIDYDTPVYLTAVAQSNDPSNASTYIIQTQTLDDQDNKIKNIKIFNTTDPTPVQIPFTFNADVTAYTVKDGGTTSTVTDYAIYVDFDVTTIKFEVEQNSSKSSLIAGSTFLGNNRLNPSTSTSDVINAFDFQLKSKDGTPGTKYTIHVYRKDGLHDQFLTKLVINGDNMYGGANNTTILENYDKTKNNMDFIMARGTNNALMTFEISEKAKYTIVDGTASPTQTNTNFPVNVLDGTYKLITIYVFSEYNKIEYPTDLTKANEYKIYIYCADQDYEITDINLLSVTSGDELANVDGATFNFVSTKKDYTDTTFEVPYKDNATIGLEVERNAYTSYVSGHINMNGVSYVDSFGSMTLSGSNPVSISNTASTISIKVQSEYAKLKTGVLSTYTGQTENYKIKVKRAAASTVNTLKSIKVVIGSNTYNIPADGVIKYEYDAEHNTMNKSGTVILNADGSLSASNVIVLTGIDKNATLASVVATKTDEKSTVSGDVGNVTLNLISNSIQTLRIYVEPESGVAADKAVYEIQVAREGVEFENVNDVSDVSMVDAENTEYLTGAYEYIATTEEYGSATNPIIIPAAQSTILFTISKKAPTSKVYQVDGGTNVLLNNDKKSYSNITEGTLYTFEFFCQSENGTNGTHYKVYFKRAAYNKDATLKSLTMNGTTVRTNPFDPLTGFDKDVNNYTVYVPYSTETAVLVGVPTQTTSTIKSNDAENPVNLLEGSNVFAIVVQSDDPKTSKAYTVTVIRDTNNELEDLKVLDDKGDNLISYVAGTPNYTGIEVPFSNETATFDYVLSGDSSLLTIELYKLVNSNEVKMSSATAPQNLSSGKNTFILKIQTTSKATKTFKVEITRKAGRSDAYITKYVTEDGKELELITTNFTYSYILSTDITTYNPEYEISTGATVTYFSTSTAINPGAKTRFQISVQSEDKSVTNKYFFDVYSASTEYDIKDIQALTKYRGVNLVDTIDNDKFVSFDEPTQMFKTGDTEYRYELHVPYSVSNFYLKTLLKNDKAKVYVNGAQANDQSYELSDSQDNTFKIQAYSEYATIPGAPNAEKYKSKEYTIVIVREEANDNVDLEELNVVIGGKTYTLITDSTIQTSEDFKVNGNLFTIENVTDTATSIKAYAEAQKPLQTSMVASFANSVAKGNGYDYTDSLATHNESTGTGYNFTYTVTVKGEGDNPKSKTYTIQVSRGVFNYAEYNEIHYITVVADGTEYFGMAAFHEGESGPYDVEIPYIASQSYTINAYIPAITKASGETIYIDDVYQPSGNKVVSFKYPETGDYTKTHTVYGCNSDLEKGTEYILNIIIKAPSKDTGLLELSIEGNNIIDLFDETGSYEYPKFPNDRIDPISVRVIAQSELSAITISRMNDYYPTSGLGTAKTTRALKEGSQTLNVTVTAQNGSTETYNIILTKNRPDPYLINLEVPGEDLLDVNNIKVEEFDPKTLEYKATVAYTTTSATINATVAAENSNYTVTLKDAVTSSSQVRSFPVALNEGTNTFKINVASPEGQSTTYTLTIKRRGVASTNTKISEINLVARETKDVLMETEDFSNDISEYFYTVPNDVRNVDVTLFDAAQANPDGATYRVLNNTDLAVGNNEVIILVTSEDKKTSSAIIVNVDREPNQFDIAINEIEKFREDFTKDTLDAVYPVNSNISELNFTVLDRVTGKPLTYEVSGGDNLVVGEETEVRLTIKAADGTFTTESLKVMREKMKFDVDKTAYEYACNEAVNAAQINTPTDLYYTINLGNKKADVISDYAKYIVNMSEGVTAKTISNPDNNASEVIVKVANSDETEVAYVHFQIQTTANNGSLFDIIFWLILLLAIILLIIILICVNRDKYGSVSKKRKA